MTDLEAHRVAELVNRHGIDQLTASRMVWCPELLDAPVPPPEDHWLRSLIRAPRLSRPGTGPWGRSRRRASSEKDWEAAYHFSCSAWGAWARARGIQIVRQRLRDVIAARGGPARGRSAREAGAAEVRARVTAALDAVDDQDGLEGVWEALGGGEGRG